MIETVLNIIEQALEVANRKGAYTLKEAKLISEKAEELKLEFERLKKIESLHRENKREDAKKEIEKAVLKSTKNNK